MAPGNQTAPILMTTSFGSLGAQPNLFKAFEPEFFMISTPAQCNSCKCIYQNPTTGTVSNRCHCGGTLHTIQGK